MRCTEMWIPDVFGYPAGLPQLFRGRRHGPLRHPEAVVEPHQPLPAPHVLVGGARRHPGAHPLPAGRHLQRRAVARRAGPRRRALRRARRGATGRSCRSATATAAAGRPGRCSHGPTAGRPRRHAAGDASARRPSSSPHVEAEAGRRRAGAGVARRALLRDAPRHADQPAAAPSSATVGASGCCARPSCGRRRPPSPAAATVDPHALDDALARGAHPAVPRHPARLVDRVGARRRRGDVRPGRRRRSTQRIADRVGDARSGPAPPRWSTPPASARDEVVVTRGVCPAGPVPAALGDGRPRSSSTRRASDSLALATGALGAVASSRSWSPTARWPTATSPSPGTSTANLTSVIDVERGREVCRPAGAAPCSSWPSTNPCSTTRGTSSRGPSSRACRSDRPGVGSTVERPDRSSGSSRCTGRSARRQAAVRYVLRGRITAGSTSRSPSTGTTDEHLLSMVFPLDVHADTATCGVQFGARAPADARRRRRGTPPSSRCARTATSTSPSRRSAWPCSTTGATATASRSDGVNTVRVSLARARRSTPTPTPTSGATP